MQSWLVGSSLVFLGLTGFASTSYSQVDVNSSAGTLTGTYPTLKDAFDAINSGTHQGIVTIGISADITETASAVLNASGSGAAIYTSIVVSPTGGAVRTISGSLAAPLIDLNGADNVTFDGLNTGGNGLTISNTSAAATAGTSTMRFINDATANLVNNCTVLGASTGAASQNGGSASAVTATILFAGSTGTTGNDNNTISNSTISDGAAVPTVAIGSAGQSAAISNDNITINGNNIANFYGTAGANGIDVASNSSAWTITGNKFYQTASRSGLVSSAYLENVYVNSAGGGFTINNNIIGYASSASTGMYTGNGGRLIGIDVAAVAATPASNIQGNTINGINWTTASSASGPGAAPFQGISVRAGGVNIGTTAGNTIGAATGTGSPTSNIYVTTSTTGTAISGIYVTSGIATLIQNNTVGAIATGGAAGMGYSFYGVTIAGAGNHTVSSNMIGGSTPGSITIGILGTTTAGSIFAGVNMAGSGTLLVGGTGAGNTIHNVLFNSTGASSVYGVYVNGTMPTGTISYNTFATIEHAAVSSGDFTAMVYVNSGSTTSTLNVTNNTIASDAFSFTGATGGTSSSASYGIYNTVKWAATNFNSNNFNNISVKSAGSFAFCYNSTNTPDITFNNNTITTGFAKTVAGGTVTLYYNFGSPTTGTVTIDGNNFSNITLTGATAFNGIEQRTTTTQIQVVTNNIISNVSTGNALLYGVYNGYGAAGSTINGNQISGLSGGNIVYGIYVGTTAGTTTIFNNQISSLAGSGAFSVNGIFVNLATTADVYKNKIHSLSSTNAGGTVNGIVLAGGTTVNTYNNVIGNLSTTIGSGSDIIRGIAVTSTTGSTTYRVYDNTVYLNASSTGANFGTSGIYHAASATATTATLDLRNNIVINESTPNGTGLTVAFRRSGTALGNYASTSNRNLFFGGAASANRLIMHDGTTPFQAFVTNYQAAVAPRDVNSFTGEAFTYGTPGSFFTSLTGSSPDFLKPVAGITTQAESGGVNITTPLITTDFAGVIRAGNAGYAGTGTSPDLGAFEFGGVSPTPVITLISVTPPTSTQCAATARVINVNVVTASGTIMNVNLAYTFNGVVQAPIVMTFVSGTTWTGTIPAATPLNATVAWGVSATSSIGLNGSYTGASYADEPLTGATASATASVTPVCSGSPVVLTAKLTKPGSAQIGTATTLTGNTAQPTAFCNRWASYRMQTVYTAAELMAAGLVAGPITSMAFTITSMGDAATNANFVVKAGTTALTAFTDFIPTTSFTTVFPSASYTHAVGVNVIPFSTAYNWDGVSNLVIEVSHSGADISYNSETYYTATPGNTVAWSTDGAAIGTPSPNRLNVIFTGMVSPAVTTVSWSDGATTVGTTNPFTANPVANTSYTGTITHLGCTIAAAPVTVTVLPLPSAPTAANSAQCGVQVPTASVTSTTGAPTPTFKWYAAASGGTALQTSTSTTYTSNVLTTTTFHVSEVDGGTGCESVRTPVTVNVSTPDAVSLNHSPAAICIGGSVTLTAANTNPTPFQSYTYSTVSTTGSGAETALAGATLTVTPTVAGTYTYNLTATDAGCGATASTTVTVNALPAITTSTATPATVCSGDAITLTATSIGAGVGPVAIGAGAQGGASDYYSPFYHNYGGVKGQYLIRASELTAAGLVAGNLTALGINITAAAGTTYNGFTVRIGATANTDLTGGFVTGLTPVYSNAAQTFTASSLNTFTFATPFAWDGTSNIVVQTSWSNNNTGGTNAGVRYDNTAYVSNAYYREDNATVATILAAPTPSGTATTRPKFTFTGNASSTNITSSLNWGWTPGAGLNTATATTSVTNLTASPVSQAFTVTVTNPLTGCTNTATTSAVTINPATPAPVANNSAQCGTGNATASVTGTGTPGNTFSWFTVPTGGTAIAGQTGNALTSYSVSATTTFYVSESNGTCSSARTPVTVTVSTPPAISVAGTATICNGNSTSLTVTSTNDPNYTYTWSGGLGTGATVSAAPTVNTTYTVSAMDASGGANNGCSTSATYAIVVNPIPAGIIATATDNTICVGEVIDLSSGGTGSTGTALAQNFDAGLGTWTTVNAGASPAATNWTLQNAPFAYDGIVDFANFATPQGGGFVISNADAGASGFTTNSQLVSPAFSTSGMATATLTFQNLYYKFGSGDITAKLDISTDGGATWSTLKDYFTLGSQGTTTSLAQVPMNESIVLGATYLNQSNLKIRYNYVSTWGFYWLIDDVKVTGTYNNTYAWTSSPAGFTSAVQNPTAVAPTTTTTYTVAVTNAFGCPATSSTTVTVNAIPTVSAGADQTICADETITLAGTGTAAVYTWDNSVVDGSTFTPAATTTYTVTGTSNGCSATDQVVVTVNALPAINAGADQTVCEGTTVTLTGTATGSSYWTEPEAEGPFTATTTTTYTFNVDNGVCDNSDQVTVTVNPAPTTNAGADQTVCEGTMITLTASGNATGYTWDNGVTNAAPFAATTTTTYTVTGTGANTCTATDAVTITVTPAPAINGGADQTICLGESVALTAVGAGIMTWDNGVSQGMPFTPTVTTTYTVEVNDGTCTNTDQVTVTVNAIPTIDAGADLGVCDGSPVTLTANATGFITWDNGVSQAVAFTPTVTATYTATVVDVNNCTNSDQIVVTVNPLPTVNAGADQTVCAGTMVTLAGTGTGTGVNYTWDNGVTNASPFAAATTTTYTVVATDVNLCTATDEVIVVVNPAPTVNAGSDLTICEGTSITLTATGTATGFGWNNGVTNGVAFTPAATTTYTVTGTGANLCTTTDQVTVTVSPIPTATATLSNNVTLTASAGTTYQWINCATNAAISGATSQTFTATANGSYKVVVTNAAGCSDTSSCIAVSTVGIKELTDASISVFPNPTHTDVTVTMTADNASVEVVDAQGKVLQVMTVSNGGKVDLSAYETGVYFLRIETETGSAMERVVKN